MTMLVPQGRPQTTIFRSGYPPRSLDARILHAQGDLLAAGLKTPQQVIRLDTISGPLTDADAPVGDPEILYLNVPPYTVHVDWSVLALRDSPGNGWVRLQAATDAWVRGLQTMERPGVAAVFAMGAQWSGPAGLVYDQAAMIAHDTRTAMYVGPAIDAWQEIEISIWVDGALLYAVQFFPVVPQIL